MVMCVGIVLFKLICSYAAGNAASQIRRYWLRAICTESFRCFCEKGR